MTAARAIRIFALTVSWVTAWMVYDYIVPDWRVVVALAVTALCGVIYGGTP